MALFGSGDSASLDGVGGDWAVGDLQTFFFSSTPFSASELEKMEKRFTLGIQRGGEMVKSPRFFWRAEGSSVPTNTQAEVNLGGCTLSKPPL